MVVPSDQSVARGEDVFLPCVVLSQYVNGSTMVTWRRSGKPSGEIGVEELDNTTKKVSIYQREEQMGGGYVLIRSILRIGRLSENDTGTYSCHAAGSDTTKSADFTVDIQGTL